MGRACSTNGEKRNIGGKARPLGRPRCRWVNNIKMDLRYGMGWIKLIWLR
jgi:hypothetical protein